MDSDEQVDWLTEAEMRAWWALLEVGSGLFDAVSSDLKQGAGLTLEDYEVLHLLSIQEDRSLRVGALADHMLSSRTRLSQRLDRMAERGLVERRRCVNDGRAIDVFLLTPGYDLLVNVAPLHLASVRRLVFDHLDAEDVEAVAVGLEKVAKYLHSERGVPRAAR